MNSTKIPASTLQHLDVVTITDAPGCDAETVLRVWPGKTHVTVLVEGGEEIRIANDTLVAVLAGPSHEAQPKSSPHLNTITVNVRSSATALVNSRKRLAALAERPFLEADHEALAKALVEASEAEGSHYVWANAEHLATTATDLRPWALQLLTAPSRDTWSGRANDARRAYYDGQRSAVQSVLSLVGALYA